MKRQILIIGKGNIGTFLGVAFAQNTDCSVLHLVRTLANPPDKVTINITDRRKALKKIKKKSTYQYCQIDNFKEIANTDFVFVPIKHTQWRNTLLEIKPYLSSKQILILCGNVLDDFDWFEQNIPCSFVFAFPNFGGAKINDALKGWLTSNFTVGVTNAVYQMQLQQVIDLLKSTGFEPKTEKNIKGWLMTHFAYNAGMLYEAASQGGFQTMTKSFSGLKKMYHKMRECMNIVKSSGIDTKSFEEGRNVYAPICWNVLKTYLLFLLPCLAKSADATKNLMDWTSYFEKLQLFAANHKIKI